MTALDGLKVLDLSWVAAGPLMTLYMAQHGATVIRVESSLRPDTLRYSRPYKDNLPGINRSGYYALINANKYSIALNLRHPDGILLLKKLATWADIMVENFTAGQLERWDLSYEKLKQINPGIILVRCSVYGQTGPQAKSSGFGPYLAGTAGFQELTGWPDRGPVLTAALTDNLTSDYALVLALEALDRRNKSGEGDCIDIAQYEVSIQALAPSILDYFANGKVARRAGSYCEYAAPHGAFRCKGQDRWCTIAVSTDAQWQRLCELIGMPELASNPDFATLTKRKENEEELNRLVERWTANSTAEEVMTKAQSLGIAAGIVATAEDLLNDPQLRHNGRYWLMDHSEIGPTWHFGAPFILSRTPAEMRSPSPCLGQHTEFVCREILGLSDDEFVRLLNERVFE